MPRILRSEIVPRSDLEILADPALYPPGSTTPDRVQRLLAKLEALGNPRVYLCGKMLRIDDVAADEADTMEIWLPWLPRAKALRLPDLISRGADPAHGPGCRTQTD